VRNPPGSGHTPFSDDGCRILVKLRQFDPQDLTPVVIDTRNPDSWESADELPLHTFGSEQVAMIRLSTGQNFKPGPDASGIEIFVVSGSIRFGDEELQAESWLRFPGNYAAELVAQEDCRLWLKRGHLPASGPLE
jgi:hypothetical protein